VTLTFEFKVKMFFGLYLVHCTHALGQGTYQITVTFTLESKVKIVLLRIITYICIYLHIWYIYALGQGSVVYQYQVTVTYI